MSVTKKNLLDAAQKVSDLVEIVQKSIDGAFHEGEVIVAPDARLSALLHMFSNPNGSLQAFLDMLGGAPAGAQPASGPPPPAAAAPAEEPDKVELTFDQFLSSVGTAMLDAQKQLDAKSSEYLGSLDGQPHILPSVFRLPKLSGTMKFALGRSTTDQMNLVFYSSGSQESSQHQQEIQFEMISAPPPQEALSALRRKAPRLDLVLDPGERTRVLSAANLPASVAAERVLVLRGEAGRTYLLLSAAAAAVSVWSVTQDQRTVVDVVDQVAGRQQDFWKSLGG